ncbi:hypothetical protein J1N35_004773 [Gossypium stocksii]|uniref:Aminotransferase-like plant mobile domain-containing protein n=1 Tax=Gossypium stocksii TaxID=47602 RepID=A0A9D3WE95_9ROSI|nr:hypothetical protein J1N35_004773 [Gossypium stocksii]
MCTTQAYIMHVIRGVLMSDANNNKVHLMYLPLLIDLHNVHSYSWGSAILAMLYRELCRTTKPDAVDIGGCLILLQSWALYWMPFLASVNHQAYVFPLVNRWSTNPGIRRSYTVLIYRLMIKQHVGEGVYKPKPKLEPKLEPKPDLKLELELESEPEPEWSHTHSEDSSYHPELRVNDYFPSSSGHGYHSEFDISSSIQQQNNTLPCPYPSYYSTPLGSYPP